MNVALVRCADGGWQVLLPDYDGARYYLQEPTLDATLTRCAEHGWTVGMISILAGDRSIAVTRP